MDVLRTSLLKTYSLIEIHRIKWNEILQGFESSLKVVSGSVDQLECVLKTEPCELSRNFPNLNDRLEQIIRALIEEELTVMVLLLEELNQLNQKMKNSSEVTYKIYMEDFNAIQGDQAFYQGTSLYPPVSSMIEWMDEIHMCYANKLANAKHSLDIFNYSSQCVTNLQNVLDPKTDLSPVDALMAKMFIFLLEK